MNRPENDEFNQIIKEFNNLCSLFISEQHDILMLKSSIFRDFMLKLDPSVVKRALLSVNSCPPPNGENDELFRVWANNEITKSGFKLKDIQLVAGIEQSRLSKLLNGKYKKFKTGEREKITDFIISKSQQF